MSSKVWIDERGPRRVGWLVAALTLLAVVWVVGFVDPWREAVRTPSEPVRVTPGRSPLPAATLPAASPVTHAAAATSAEAVQKAGAFAVTCPHQRLDVVMPRGKSFGACIAATRSTQSGDMRSYWLDAQGVSSWRLRIDTGLTVVLAAELSSPNDGVFRCEGEACAGIRIGPRDAHGGRAIDIDNVVFVPDAASGTTASGADGAGSLNVSARLAVPGDAQTPELACAGESIAVVERSGAVLALCASGGGGLVMEGDQRVYRLRGAAGDTLQVGVDANGAVDLVQIGPLLCRGFACAGASTQAGPEADREAGRTFTFSGTTITDGRPDGHSATLNGRAVLPEF